MLFKNASKRLNIFPRPFLVKLLTVYSIASNAIINIARFFICRKLLDTRLNIPTKKHEGERDPQQDKKKKNHNPLTQPSL